MLLRLSEMFIILTMLALGFSSMLRGGPLATAFHVLVVVLAVASGIACFVKETIYQPFATGFLIAFIAYAGFVFYGRDHEFDPYSARLPSSAIFLPLYRSVVAVEQVFTDTMEPVPQLDDYGGGYGGELYWQQRGRQITSTESPSRTDFMMSAHALIGLILGYVGGKFGTLLKSKGSVQSRRTTE